MFKRLSMLIIVVFLVSCSVGNKPYSSNYSIGLIESTGQKNNSVITYFKEDLTKVNSISYPYGSMNYHGFATPIVEDGFLYTIPLGLSDRKDLGILMKMALESGKTETIKFNRTNITGAVVTKDAYYVVSNLNSSSYIDRYDRLSNQIETVVMDNSLVMSIAEHQGKIVGTGVLFEDAEKYQVWLLEFDFDTKSHHLLADLSPFCKDTESPSHFLSYGDKLYMTYLDNLLVYESSNDFVSAINLNAPYANQMIVYKEQLYIVHADVVTHAVKSKITVFDPKTQLMKTHELNNNVIQIEVLKDKMIALDLDTDSIYVYQVENDQIKQINQIVLSPTKNLYMSAIFVK